MGPEVSPRLNDAGLEEMIDPTTKVDQVVVDEKQKGIVEQLQQRRGGFWVMVIVALVLLSEQSALAFTVFAPILPQFAGVYQTDQIVWILTVFSLSGAVFGPILAKLGDIHGKKKLLVITAGIATVGAIIGFLAPNFIVLLIGRAIMGVAVAFAPLTFGLMRDTFPPKLRSLGISIATNGIGVVVIAGPILASLLVDNFGTQSVFVLMAVISLLGMLLIGLIVPESPLRAKGHIDWFGAILLVIGVLAAQIAITQAGTWGYLDWRTLLLFFGGIAVLVLWFFQQRAAKEPIISMRLLTRRPFWTPLISIALIVSATAMGSYLVPQMLATPADVAPGYGQGLVATQIALVFAPAGVLVIVGGIFVGLTARSIGFRNQVLIGAALVAVHAIFLAMFHTEVWHYVLAYALGGLGLLVLAARPNLILLAVPEDQRAVANGIVGTADGIIGGTMQQIAFVILAGSVLLQIAPGVNLYNESGFVTALFVGGAIAIVGGLLALAIPQGRRVTAAVPETAGKE
jgi:MFS family permease